ncbi:MAG: nucleoside deaminase [Chitinispirillaceae bacterium]|nr:nucleoside deaminase [Chitinispirillaceae bacterium]
MIVEPRTPAYFMQNAYQEALKALDEGEVPVGAVIEKNGTIIGRGYNRIEKLADATAHAEIIAITAAAASLATWRLDGCTIYVTLEPCIMCLGALLQSRINGIVYAASDPRLGAVTARNYRPPLEEAYGFFPDTSSGLMAQECTALLKSFFRELRKKT